MSVPQLLQHEAPLFLPGLSHSSLPFRCGTSILLDAQGLDSPAFLLLRLCQVKVSCLWASGERRGSCGLPSTAPPPSFEALALCSFLSEVTTFVRSKLKQDQDRSGKWKEGGEERVGRGGLRGIRQLGSLVGGEAHMEESWKERGFPGGH